MEAKRTSSKIIGSAVFAILFLQIGIYDLFTKEFGYPTMIWFAISCLSFLYFIYQYKRLKNNPGEMYDDERKQFISEKSLGISFRVLFVVILILKLFIERNTVEIESSSLLTMLLGVALIVQSISYLICKYKY